MEPQTNDPIGPEEPTRRLGGLGAGTGGGRPPLRRTLSGRVFGGVCAGVARYLSVDVLIVRIAAVALVLAGGLGVLLYVGGLLLMPEQDGEALADTTSTRGRVFTAIGVVALVAAAALVLSGALLASVSVLFPLAALGLVGLAVWWLSSGEGFTGDWRKLLTRSALGLAVLAISTVVFVTGFWAAGTGSGTLAAGLVIGAGVAVAIGAFTRPVRWLIPPALSLALGVGLVSAAGVDLDGGVGEREYRPVAGNEVRDSYELGAGRLVVDLRGATLPKGDVRLKMDLGMGEALLLVPENVCVASSAQVGAGAVEVFDRENGGVDLDWEDRPVARPTSTRVVVDADVGLGLFHVAHEDTSGEGHSGHGGFGRSLERNDSFGNDAGSVRTALPGNAACLSRGPSA